MFCVHACFCVLVHYYHQGAEFHHPSSPGYKVTDILASFETFNSDLKIPLKAFWYLFFISILLIKALFLLVCLVQINLSISKLSIHICLDYALM